MRQARQTLLFAFAQSEKQRHESKEQTSYRESSITSKSGDRADALPRAGKKDDVGGGPASRA